MNIHKNISYLKIAHGTVPHGFVDVDVIGIGLTFRTEREVILCPAEWSFKNESSPILILLLILKAIHEGGD